jgi:hypothetical protein
MINIHRPLRVPKTQVVITRQRLLLPSRVLHPSRLTLQSNLDGISLFQIQRLRGIVIVHPVSVVEESAGAG